MRRLRRGLGVAVLLSMTLALITIIYPWCEVWPWDILCWLP